MFPLCIPWLINIMQNGWLLSQPPPFTKGPILSIFYLLPLFPMMWAAAHGKNWSESCNIIAINELKKLSPWKYTGFVGEKRGEVLPLIVQMMNEYTELFPWDTQTVRAEESCSEGLHQWNHHSKNDCSAILYWH